MRCSRCGRFTVPMHSTVNSTVDSTDFSTDSHLSEACPEPCPEPCLSQLRLLRSSARCAAPPMSPGQACSKWGWRGLATCSLTLKWSQGAELHRPCAPPRGLVPPASHAVTPALSRAPLRKRTDTRPLRTDKRTACDASTQLAARLPPACARCRSEGWTICWSSLPRPTSPFAPCSRDAPVGSTTRFCGSVPDHVHVQPCCVLRAMLCGEDMACGVPCCAVRPWRAVWPFYAPRFRCVHPRVLRLRRGRRGGREEGRALPGEGGRQVQQAVWRGHVSSDP